MAIPIFTVSMSKCSRVVFMKMRTKSKFCMQQHYLRWNQTLWKSCHSDFNAKFHEINSITSKVIRGRTQNVYKLLNVCNVVFYFGNQPEKLRIQIAWGQHCIFHSAATWTDRTQCRRLTLFPCLSTGSGCSKFPEFCGLPGKEAWFVPPDEGLAFLDWLFGALCSCSFSSVVRVMMGGDISLICCCSDIADTALGGNGSRPITEPDPEAATHKTHLLQTKYHHNLFLTLFNDDFSTP
jgi:hypothetical protein